MPKSNLDWLGVASLWVGVLVEALKTAGFPLVTGAPAWLASHAWGYVPFFLITIYLGIALFRQFRTAPPAPEPLSKDAPLAPPAKPQYNPALIAAREDRRVLSALESAKTTAAAAVARRTVRDAEMELPTMKAALLSAHKHFQIPLPPEKDEASTNLEIGRRLIEKILPFLEAKHIEEAGIEAAKFNKRFEPKDENGGA